MSESEGIVGLLTPKTQEGIKKLKTSTGYDLSKVNLNEGELKRLQAYQGFVKVVKDVLTTVVLNEGLDEPTREKYNAALKEADEFLTHLEVRTLGVTFFRSLYKSAARLVEEQKTLAGSSNEKAGLLEVQLAELNERYAAIEAQYGADKQAWATKEQGYQQELAQKDGAYRVLKEGKDVLQELANTLARANGDLRNESARKDNLIYELGQARERDAAKLAKVERDLEARVGQEKANTNAAEDKLNNVVEALKQTLIVNYGLTDEELLNIPKDKDLAEFYLGLLNEKIAQDKSSIQAVEARLEEERRQRADNYKSAVEGQPVEPGQDDLTEVLDELDSSVGLDVGEVPATGREEPKPALAEPESHDDAEEARKIAERTLARFQEIAELPARTLDEVTAGMGEEVAPPVEEAPEPVDAHAVLGAKEPRHILADALGREEPPHALAELGAEPNVDLGAQLELVAPPVEEVPEPVAEEEHVVNVVLDEPVVPVAEAPVAPVVAEPDLADVFAAAVPPVTPAPATPETLDLSETFAASLPEGVAQPPAVPKELDLVSEFGDAVPVEEPN